MDDNENPNLACMLALIKSNDPVVSDEVSTTLKNIINNGDNDILKNCFEHYVKIGCKVTLDILASVKAPMNRILLEYMSSILHMHPFAVLDFLFLTVKKSPTWIHHLTENVFFKNLTEFVEQSNNVAFVIGILYVLASLLPQLPSLSTELDTLFGLFIAAAKLLYDSETGYKRALRKALVTYCQSLYTLYPCSFIGYMRSEFASQPPNSSQLLFFATVIRPILKAITVHPLIITSTKDAEISKDRWLNKEPRDSFIESLDVSVDQTDDCMLECIPTEVTTVPNVYYANWQGAISNFNSDAIASSDVVELHRRGSGGNSASFRSKFRNQRSDLEDASSVDGRVAAEKNEQRPRLRCQTTPKSEHELLASKRERAVHESRKALNSTTTSAKDSSTDSPRPVTPTFGGNLSVGSCNEDPGARSNFSSAASHQQLKQRRSFGSAIAKLFRLPQQTTGSTSNAPSQVPPSPSTKMFGLGESAFPNMIRLVERDSDARTLLKQAEAQPTEIAKEANEEDSPTAVEQLRTMTKEPQPNLAAVTADVKHCSSISSSTGQVFSGKSSSFFGPPPQMRSISSAGQQQQQQQQQRKLTKQTSSAVLCNNSATVGTAGMSVTASAQLTKAKHEDNKTEKKMPILQLRRFSSCPNLTFTTGDNNKPTFTNTLVNTTLPASPSIFPAFSSSPIQQQQHGDIRPELEVNFNSVDEMYINLGEELYSEMTGRWTNSYNRPTDTVQARHSNDNVDEKSIQVDNASIWKTKIHLLEYELEFERYKRDQHAERNQRLNDRLKHLIALEQYLQNNIIQIRWLFHQRAVLNERVAKLKSENLRIQNTFLEKERTWLNRYAQLSRENQQLKQNVQAVEQTVDSIEEETIKVFQELEVVSKELTEKQLKMELWEKNIQSSGTAEQGLLLTVRTLQDQLATMTEQCREHEAIKLDLVMTEKRLAEVEALTEQQAEEIDRLKSTSWTKCHKQRIAMQQPSTLRLKLAAKEKLIEKLKALTERENSEIQALHHMHAQLQAVCCEKDSHLVDFYKQMNTTNVDDSSGHTADNSTAQTGDPSSLATTRTEPNTSSADSTDNFRSSI
ncbi:Hamartin [Trichinella pseudospiralis]|uniref:Hamartin n=1 Tax=Trichinella pseudospiralis TaxID=6337 RepID=A0A0V1FTP8_TRIPS|nr:Hamartin [Trichinella pseudospiralis]